MSTLKRALIGEPQWFGTEKFLEFGTEHHKRSLEPKELTTCLDKNDQLCTDMATSFRSHPEVKKILRGAVCEKEFNVVYRGVWVKLFLDIYKPLRGWDLKGTSCENERQFIKKAREYDYFRQAALYIGCAKLKEFSFIGQGKNRVEQVVDIDKYSQKEYALVHPLYFLNVMDYPLYLQEGKEELHQLIDVHIQLRRYYEKAKAA